MQNDEGDRPYRQPSEPEPDAEQRPADEPLAPSDAGSGQVPEPQPGPPTPQPESEPPAPEPSWPTEPPAAEATSADAWPTEPPAADSGDADTWPTRSPERAEELPPAAGQEEMETPVAPAWETTQDAASSPASAPATEWPTEPGQDEAAGAPEATTGFDAAPGDEGERQPPPSEVEAYPGGGPAAEDVAPVAAAAHSVPASGASFGESTLCPRCGTENRAGLAFCRNCGQRLVAAGTVPTIERPTAPEGTQACPRCGTHNRAGVAFCQNCGANLRAAATGYVPPAVGTAPAEAAAERRGGAALGPIVLIVGIIGIVTAYLLPFAYGTNSLYERALSSGGYGIAFWNGYADVSGGLADQAYFGLAAPSPLVAVILLLLAFAGFVRAAPGAIQRLGILVALLWSIATAALFVVVEVLGAWEGDVVGLLRDLSPAGIIFFLASLIVLIGTLTRLARS